MDVAAEPHRRVAEIWIADAHFVPVPASADYGTQSPRLCVSVDDNEDETLFLLPSFFFFASPTFVGSAANNWCGLASGVLERVHRRPVKRFRFRHRRIACTLMRKDGLVCRWIRSGTRIVGPNGRPLPRPASPARLA